MADKMAKEYMTRAEEMKAAPYFTSYEEEIVLFHEGTLIEGDIRVPRRVMIVSSLVL